jgi:hypothetical protein
MSVPVEGGASDGDICAVIIAIMFCYYIYIYIYMLRITSYVFIHD